MATIALTDMAIRAMPVPARGQTEVWDLRIPGFGVRASSAGTKSFVLVYRFQGRPRRMTLGRYPTLSLADARKLASKALRQVALGADPASEKALEKVIVASRVRTFAATVDEYVEKYARPKNRDWQTARDILVREYVAAWTERPLTSITQDDVVRVIDRVVARTSAATGHNRFVYVRHFFNWCVERGYLDASPIAKLKPPPKAKDRDRVLTDDELGRILSAADQMQYPYGSIIELLILTAQRRNEVAGMRWSELDLRAGEWSLAADRTKSARKHVVPLSSVALKQSQKCPLCTISYYSRAAAPTRSRQGSASGRRSSTRSPA